MTFWLWFFAIIIGLQATVAAGRASYRRGRNIAQQMATQVRQDLVLIDSGFGLHAKVGLRPRFGWGYLFAAPGAKECELGIYITVWGKVLFSDGPLVDAGAAV